jgi:nucleotide-binding universal stress UspA family protein
MKVLIAVDDSPWSQAAIEFVKRMTWPAKSEFVVLSAAAPMTSAYAFQDVPGTAPVLTPELLELQFKHHQEVATRYGRQLQEAGLANRAVAVTADPREAILDAAVRERTDLIVVGSHGRSGLKRLLMGSVSSHVVDHARCSVLVVKLPEQK